MKEELIEKLIEKYKSELEIHGITHFRGFKHRLEFYNKKLEENSKKCNVTHIQYLDVLNSNWRELYEFQEKHFYDYIIKDYYKIEEK